MTGGRKSSKYRGVSWHTARCIWQAAIAAGGKGHNLGYHTDEEGAARAAAAAAAAEEEPGAARAAAAAAAAEEEPAAPARMK